MLTKTPLICTGQMLLLVAGMRTAHSNKTCMNDLCLLESNRPENMLVNNFLDGFLTKILMLFHFFSEHFMVKSMHFNGICCNIVVGFTRRDEVNVHFMYNTSEL